MLVAFLATIGCLPGLAEIIRLSDGAMIVGNPCEPARTVELVGGDIIVTYEFREYGLTPQESNPMEYNLSLPDFSVCSTPGMPAYLFKKDLLNVPDSETANVELIEAEYQDFNLKLAPAQPLQVMNEDSDLTPVPISSYTGFKPETPIADTSIFPFRDHGVVEVIVTPTVYSVEDEVLRLYKKLSYKVSTTQDGISLLSETELSPEFNINQSIGATTKGATVYAYDVTASCLIISVPEYTEALKPFIQWKRTLGIPVTAVYSSNWTADAIKNKIKETYEADSKLNYLLFVGNQSQVPGVYGGKDPHAYNKGEWVNWYSDFDYSCITNKNNMPEVIRGRFPVNTVDELKTVVDKIIKYEKTPVEDEAFYNSGVLMSYLDTPLANGTEDVPGNSPIETRCFLAITEEVHDYLTTTYNMNLDRLYSYTHPYGYFKGVTQWGANYNNLMISEDLNRNQSFWDHGNQDFVDKINEGRCFGFYLGHGNWDCFYNGNWIDQGQFDFDKIESLRNGDRLPFIIAHSCLTGNFAMDNVANRLLTNKNGGCIGYFGATNSIFITGALRMAIKTVHSIWNEGKFETQIASNLRPAALSASNRIIPLRAGEIFNMVIEDKLRSEVGTHIDSKGSHFFGDPTMYFRLTNPTKPKNIEVSYADNTINIECSSEPYNIAFYDSASGITECWYGVKASYETLKPRSVSICIYGPNTIPSVFHYGSVDQPILEAQDMAMSCSNKPGLKLSLELTNSVPSTVTVTNLATQAQSVIEIEGGCEQTEVTLPAAGNYGVTLVADGNVLQTQKIQITQ